MNFREEDWSRVEYDSSNLDLVENTLRSFGVDISDYDLSKDLDSFNRFIGETEYTGDYQLYGGAERHCFLEKALEHFVSLKFVDLNKDDVCIDVGSCKSVFPKFVERISGATCYAQDLVYPDGVSAKTIGSSADSIPLADNSVSAMFLHCTFEHFEGLTDSGYIRECGRLLKKGGKTVILPLYLNQNYCNITGETDANKRSEINFDPDSSYYCVIPEWKNRFGRHYSAEAFLNRVFNPAQEMGLLVKLYRCKNWESIDTRLWLRWVLVLEHD